MTDKEEARELLDEVFEELALLIGGLVAYYGLRDDIVRNFVRTLDFVRDMLLRRIEEGIEVDEAERTPSGSTLRPHPAIEEFLLSLRRA